MTRGGSAIVLVEVPPREWREPRAGVTFEVDPEELWALIYVLLELASGGLIHSRGLLAHLHDGAPYGR